MPWYPGWTVTISVISEALGDVTFAASRDSGAALSYQEAGEVARGLIQRARDELGKAP